VKQASVLQEQYDVSGLSTIRQAQPVLQDEGLIRPAQSRGTFVIALPSDEPASLRDALGHLETALTTIRHFKRLMDTPPPDWPPPRAPGLGTVLLILLGTNVLQPTYVGRTR
jgi:hypothetical protein